MAVPLTPVIAAWLLIVSKRSHRRLPSSWAFAVLHPATNRMSVEIMNLFIVIVIQETDCEKTIWGKGTTFFLKDNEKNNKSLVGHQKGWFTY
jgi:hypothetical protein